jgi:metal-responsive CopG/Arc/MetJ family transcriptional regulator
MRKERMRVIVLRLAEDTVDRIDNVRYELGGMSRTAWLRRAVRRQLDHANRNELPLVSDPAIRRVLER